MSQVVQIDVRDVQVTPFFYTADVENIPKSEHAGYAVMETADYVRVDVAGDRNFSPVFLADSFSHRVNGRPITYKERWKDQYEAWKRGATQIANGTDLAELIPHGLNEKIIGICKSLKIYSIEAALNVSTEGQRGLGIYYNDVRDAAKRWEDANNPHSATHEMIQLRNQIEEMKALLSTLVPAQPLPLPDVSPEPTASATSEYVALKDEIEALTGSRPRGNPNGDTLREMLRQARAETEG